MAGHSHFANIKHKKASNDIKKAKILSKIGKEIMIAIKDASINPDENPKLRLVLEKARANNIPKDNIERILKSNNKDKTNFNEITYEGYGNDGVAIIVECLTDNVNRTAAEVRATFSKNGGNLGVLGSVSYLFEVKGILVIDASILNLDKALEIGLESNVLNVKQEEDVIIIETNKTDLISVKEKFMENGITEYLQSEITKVPINYVSLDDQQYSKLEKLIDALELLDDVQNVYHNAN